MENRNYHGIALSKPANINDVIGHTHVYIEHAPCLKHSESKIKRHALKHESKDYIERVLSEGNLYLGKKPKR